MRNRLSSYLKESPYKIHVNFKGTRSIFTVEKSGRYHHDQVIKVNPATLEPECCHLVPPHMRC